MIQKFKVGDRIKQLYDTGVINRIRYFPNGEVEMEYERPDGLIVTTPFVEDYVKIQNPKRKRTKKAKK